jgi:uncharacterized protein (TIGR02145 family)
MNAKNIVSLAAAVLTLWGAALLAGCGENPDTGGGGYTPLPEPVDPALLTDDGVEINGVRWATRNVDKPGQFTAKTEEPGMFYQWNIRIGWNGTDIYPVSSEGETEWPRRGGEGEAWAPENDPSPEGWRVPGNSEFEKLIDMEKVSRRWSVSPIAGCTFTDIESGKSVFFPAAGFRAERDGLLNFPGMFARYWSTTTNNDVVEAAYYLNIIEGPVAMLYFQTPGYGMSLRPVASE